MVPRPTRPVSVPSVTAMAMIAPVPIVVPCGSVGCGRKVAVTFAARDERIGDDAALQRSFRVP